MQLQKEPGSLVALARSGATARVLNLARRRVSAHRRAAPGRSLFDNRTLDRSIFVKHRLRPNEQLWYARGRSVTTKVLIPIDPVRLEVGAFSFLVGQKGWEHACLDTGGSALTSSDRDRIVLRALDELPTLDPFLVREHLRRAGVQADDSYFEISAADVARMYGFVERDIMPLVSLCFGQEAEPGDPRTRRLCSKILEADMDASMEPLRETLRMDEAQFLQSLFCWKGFLYYKWVLADTVRAAREVAAEIRDVKVKGRATSDELTYIYRARSRLHDGVRGACDRVASILQGYDDAFRALTCDADPVAFRAFLLDAPRRFFEVGERLGAVQHVNSYWRYRSPGAERLEATDLCDLLQDFEQGLGLTAEQERSWR